MKQLIQNQILLNVFINTKNSANNVIEILTTFPNRLGWHYWTEIYQKQYKVL